MSGTCDAKKITSVMVPVTESIVADLEDVHPGARENLPAVLLSLVALGVSTVRRLPGGREMLARSVARCPVRAGWHDGAPDWAEREDGDS